MLGRNVYEPVHILFSIDQANHFSKTQAEYVVSLEKTLKEIHDLVWKDLLVSVFFDKWDYDQHLYPAYNEGDVGYILEISNTPRIRANLQLVYSGPFRAIKQYSPLLYLVQERKHKSIAHHDQY